MPCCGPASDSSALNNCYPHSKDLTSAGPEYRPLSQELSRLTALIRDKPSKLISIADSLERRTAKEAQRAAGGNDKSRASLLVSLAILRTLITECKRDLATFSRAALSTISSALDVRIHLQSEPDLDVARRATSCFIAFATYTDGSVFGMDAGMVITAAYLGVLAKIANLAQWTAGTSKPLTLGAASGGGASTDGEKEKPKSTNDIEKQQRARQIGLAGLSNAASSDAMLASPAIFPRQCSIIIPALLASLADASMDDLKAETSKIDTEVGPSPFFTEFSARRSVSDRRAPSLYSVVAKEGVGGGTTEKAPTARNVIAASLRCVNTLFGQLQYDQAMTATNVVLSFIDQKGAWSDKERWSWLGERLAIYMNLQYRYIVPTRLAAMLVTLPDSYPATFKHETIIAMITQILNSSISLVGLAVSDLLDNLVHLIRRRIKIDQQDALLPHLVQCIASLGSHVYYADQINDIVEGIAHAVARVPHDDKTRPETLRVLTQCMIAVMTSARIGDEADIVRRQSISMLTSSGPISTKDKGKGPQVDTPSVEFPHRENTRRNPIEPAVWQETLPLLCEATYPIRETYARALLHFLEHELPRESQSRRPNPDVVRFYHALHAAVYTLAMSSRLHAEIVGLDATPVAIASVLKEDDGKETEKLKEDSIEFPIAPVEISSDLMPSLGTEGTKLIKINGNGTKRNSKEVTFDLNDSGQGEDVSDPTSNLTPKKRRPRAMSFPLNRVNSGTPIPSYDSVATPFDFAAIIHILRQAHCASPVAALLTGVPMLLALDNDAGTQLVRRAGDDRADAYVLERKRAIRETVTVVWHFVGTKWNLPPIIELAVKVIHSLPEPLIVPDMRPGPPPEMILPQAAEGAAFYRDQKEGESSATSRPILDPEVIVDTLAGSGDVQVGTGSDEEKLKVLFNAPWTVDLAIQESFEGPLLAAPIVNGHGPNSFHQSSANESNSKSGNKTHTSGSNGRLVNSSAGGSGIPGKRVNGDDGGGNGDQGNEESPIAPGENQHSKSLMMNISNPSLSSFARHSRAVVDVDDLRDALTGRGFDSSSYAPSIVSTSGRLSIPSSSGTGSGKMRLKKVVKVNYKDVLNDIFKDKKKNSNGGGGERGGRGGGELDVPSSTSESAAVAAAATAEGVGQGPSFNVGHSITNVNAMTKINGSHGAFNKDLAPPTTTTNTTMTLTSPVSTTGSTETANFLTSREAVDLVEKEGT